MGLLDIHIGRPVIGGHVRDIYLCPVLATGLAQIKLNVMNANQQLSGMELNCG
jgi:hypothetical protein